MNVKSSKRQKIIELLLSSPKTIQQLLKLTRFPERTLRYHLSILRRKGIVREMSLFSDRRKKLVSLSKKFKKSKEASLPTDHSGSVKGCILGTLNMVRAVGFYRLKLLNTERPIGCGFKSRRTHQKIKGGEKNGQNWTYT